VGAILSILLAANVLLAALTFYVFHEDGIWLNWELKELVACEVGRCVHPLVRLGVERLHVAGGRHREDGHEGAVDGGGENKQPAPLRYACLVRDKVTLDFWDKIAADVSKTVRQPVKGSRPIWGQT